MKDKSLNWVVPGRKLIVKGGNGTVYTIKKVDSEKVYFEECDGIERLDMMNDSYEPVPKLICKWCEK